MESLGRKVDRRKWGNAMTDAPATFPADAITVDLRTSANVLSTWTARSDDPKSQDDVALALVAASETLDKLDVLFLPASMLVSAFQVASTPGATCVGDLTGRHHDVGPLDYGSLGRFANVVVTTMRSEGGLRRWTKKELTTLLRAAVDSKRLALDDLKPKVRELLARPG